jgi:hypothetical protein
MDSLLARADDVLRHRARTVPTRRNDVVAVATLVAVFGSAYGAAMGSFGGLLGQAPLQMLYSAVKVPLLLLVTFALGLPSFYVINSLMGLSRDFAQAVRALVAAQAALAIVLASLAPFTLFWYVSFADYSAAVTFNAAMFAVASFAAQWVVRGYYRPLIDRNPRHRWMLRAWIVVYAFVGIQMGWVLRPFIGAPGTPVQFLRPEAWDNAYVIVARMLWRVITQ